MPSAGHAAVHRPQQYHPVSTSSSIPSSLINIRPIIPLPKRRVPSSTSSSTTTSSTTLPLPPPQIFSHTYPPAAVSQSTPPFHPQGDDYESSDSEDDGDDAGSTVSSLGREDFNLKNKKKRKIPLSATTTGNVTTGLDGTSSIMMGRVGSKGRLSGWRVPSATLRGEGGYRRKTRVSRSLSATYPDRPENETTPNEREKTTETTAQDTPTSPAPSGPFSFTYPSPLTLPISPHVTSLATTNPTRATQTSHPSAPPTAPLPVPPPPPPVQGQENIPPSQPYPQQPPQQGQQPPPQRLPPPGMKHPNSEKARRVAQLTKLRERYRTGPKPDTDELYICPLCTYGFIYGEDPIYLVRQYNRKRNAELRLRRERRKMLEKARMKGKKTPLPVTQSVAPGNEDYDDDELCCTCGQNVGQHNHVPTSNAPMTQSAQGPGPGKTK